MAKQEAQTDLWVARMLDDAGISYAAQGSDVLEVNDALKTASKSGTGNAGYPEFVAVVKGFVLVIEDKASMNNHIRLDDNGLVDLSTSSVKGYAVNGALYYAKHIARGSTFKRVFAVGISGDEKHHRITPYYVNDREGYEELEDLETLVSFSPANIGEYYLRSVLHEQPDDEKTTEEIIADAKELHDYLYRYGALGDREKPIVVSGILLALDEIETGGFSIDSLKGDRRSTDGKKIWRAIEDRLKRSNVSPEDKRDKLMAEFSLFRTNTQINTVNDKLGKTPLRFYTEFLYKRVFKNIKAQTSSEDFIGRFYGEFVSYSGGDGQSLGVVLTPKHICDLFCELVNIKANDVVLDPCCGSAAFLVAAMHHMLAKADDGAKDDIKTKQLHGFELRSDMFTIAVTNMILREDGNSNIQQTNFISQQIPAKVQLKGATVGMMNPPYSQGSVRDAPELFEICFVEHLLDCLVKGGRAAVIVPQSTMTGKSIVERKIKRQILKHHTLEGVITCNTDTFYGVGTNPVIAVFTAHRPHPEDKACRFIDFRDDGYRVHAHVGLVEEPDAKDKRAHLLSVWRGEQEAPTSFCVESTVEPEDEWLHSFYYFNDAIPDDADFEKAIGDYLTFEFSMVMQNREYLFTGGDKWMLARYKEYLRARLSVLEYEDVPALNEVDWQPMLVSDIFEEIGRGKRLKKADQKPGDIPYVSSTAMNNGIDGFIEASPGARVFSDCISLANSGSVGSAFYEPYDFVASDHVTHLKTKGFSRWTYLFLATVLRKQSVNFNFNREINDARIKKMKVMVPCSEEGKPDYAYMEQYAKNMMLRKYQQYLDYLDMTDKHEG